MHWNWLLAALLVLQQPNGGGSVRIEHRGEVVEEVQTGDYIYPLPGVPMVDDNKLNALMDGIAKRTDLPPVNAALNGAGGIVPEQPGNVLDRNDFQSQFFAYIYEGSPAAIELRQRSVYPRVDSELLSAIKAKTIGSYVTYYNNGNRNRSSNIALAARTLNNYVVFPGERFSFNQALGKRTKEKGYLRAPVIVRGEMNEDVGGGICQVSSTLFNAADRAGLKIVERFSHSRKIHYVPPGRDATVSWYGPDFVFENPYSDPVLIRAYAGSGRVNITICSTELIEPSTRSVPEASRKLPEEVKTESPR